MKTGIKILRERHPGFVIILQMADDHLQKRKENQSIAMLWCYFHINVIRASSHSTGDGKNDDDHGDLYEDVWHNIIQYISWVEDLSPPIKDSITYLKPTI